MKKNTIIYKSIVGSTMHGLRTENSDEDARYITLPTLRQIISPFQNDQIKVRDGNGNDEESWDLAHFCRHLTQGNPTVYEVLQTDHYDKTLPYAELIRSLMPYAFNGQKIMYAHIGYTEAQLKRYLRKALNDFNEYFMYDNKNDGKLLGIPKWESKDGKIIKDGYWEENHLRRIPKTIVAAYRVLAQGKQLLETGDFEPVVYNYSSELHDRLMIIKTMDILNINRSFIVWHILELEKQIQELKIYFETLDDSIKFSKPNIEKIEDILCEIYKI